MGDEKDKKETPPSPPPPPPPPINWPENDLIKENEAKPNGFLRRGGKDRDK